MKLFIASVASLALNTSANATDTTYCFPLRRLEFILGTLLPCMSFLAAL